jgi:hypothetical protein
MRTFRVSDVTRAVDPIPEVDARLAIEKLAGSALEASYTTPRPLAKAWKTLPHYESGVWSSEEVPYHPFVAAVHAAFDQHRPLVLSPDAIWLMIAQGFAHHVVKNAEALRDRIVPFEGRELVSVRRDDFVRGSPHNDWPGAFAELSQQIAARTGVLHGIVVADFSTTDATARAASELVLLSAASLYFKLEMMTMCGIPEITLSGTAGDWQRVRARAEALRAYDCGPWVDALAPILDHFVAAEAGTIDRDHWESFYKRKNASGGPYVTGWINVLLPYVLDHTGKITANPNVHTWKKGMGSPFGGGPSDPFLPSGLSIAPFLWRYLGQELRMELMGGFAGVSQDRRTLALAPEIGWAVREVR